MADSCRSFVAITISNIPNNCRPNASVMKRSPKKKNPTKSEGYKNFPLTNSIVTFLSLPSLKSDRKSCSNPCSICKN